jgi:hypothetical protein
MTALSMQDNSQSEFGGEMRELWLKTGSFPTQLRLGITGPVGLAPKLPLRNTRYPRISSTITTLSVERNSSKLPIGNQTVTLRWWSGRRSLRVVSVKSNVRTWYLFMLGYVLFVLGYCSCLGTVRAWVPARAWVPSRAWACNEILSDSAIDESLPTYSLPKLTAAHRYARPTLI